MIITVVAALIQKNKAKKRVKENVEIYYND